MFFICSSYVLVLADAGFLPLAPACYLSHDSRLSGEHACRSDTSEKLHRVHWLCSASPCTEIGKFLDLSHFRSRIVSLEERHLISPWSSAASPGSVILLSTSEVTCFQTSHCWPDSLLRVESMIANPWSYAARFGFDNFFQTLGAPPCWFRIQRICVFQKDLGLNLHFVISRFGILHGHSFYLTRRFVLSHACLEYRSRSTC